MIIRLWLITGTLLVAVAWGLTVFVSPADYQKSAGTAVLENYRTAKLMPGAGEFRLSSAIGHEVFEIPASDAAQLKIAMESGGGMPGMKMDMAAKTDGHAAEPAMKMDMPGMKMEMAAEPAMKMDDHGSAETGGGHSAAGSGLTILASGMARGHGMVGPKAYMNARRIDLAMKEWGYSAPSLTVKTGEVVRFVVTNKGSMPHEFMLMGGPAMQAVNYRLGRADWNLTEHEAPYENPVVMPGDTFELLVRADKPGMWMYMCMFPYHMQLGMMGMLMASGGGASGAGAMQGMKMDMPGMNMK